jgi:hypothetical protein
MGGQYVQEKCARFPDALYRGRCAGDSGIARRLNPFSMPGNTMIIGILNHFFEYAEDLDLAY